MASGLHIVTLSALGPSGVCIVFLPAETRSEEHLFGKTLPICSAEAQMLRDPNHLTTCSSVWRRTPCSCWFPSHAREPGSGRSKLTLLVRERAGLLIQGYPFHFHWFSAERGISVSVPYFGYCFVTFFLIRKHLFSLSLLLFLSSSSGDC